jgi:hypothetical protein
MPILLGSLLMIRLVSVVPVAAIQPFPFDNKEEDNGTAVSYGSAPQALPNSSMAIVSLIAGILGITLVPINSIVALITGYMARKEIRGAQGPEGDGMARLGLVLGWIGGLRRARDLHRRDLHSATHVLPFLVYIWIQFLAAGLVLPDLDRSIQGNGGSGCAAGAGARRGYRPSLSENMAQEFGIR